MKSPGLVWVAIFIATVTFQSYFTSAQYVMNKVSEGAEMWMSNEVCSHGSDCDPETSHSGELDVDVADNYYSGADAHTHSNVDNLGERMSQTDRVEGFQDELFDKASGLWERGETMSQSIEHLRKDLDQIPDSRLQLSKMAVESSLLDLEDQLDEQVFKMLRRWYHLQHKYASTMAAKAVKLLDRAEGSLLDIGESYNHISKVLKERLKAARESISQRMTQHILISKRSVETDHRKYVTSGSAPLFLSAVILIGLVTGCAMLAVFLRHRHKIHAQKLPFTIYDN